MHRMETLPSIFKIQFSQRKLWALRPLISIGYSSLIQEIPEQSGGLLFIMENLRRYKKKQDQFVVAVQLNLDTEVFRNAKRAIGSSIMPAIFTPLTAACLADFKCGAYEQV